MLKNIELDENFDPENYDEQMNSLFDEQYYNEEDYEKPQFEYNELIDEDFPDEYDTGNIKSTAIEEVLNKHKQKYGQPDKEIDSYLEEYYQLDYEDIVRALLL